MNRTLSLIACAALAAGLCLGGCSATSDASDNVSKGFSTGSTANVSAATDPDNDQLVVYTPDGTTGSGDVPAIKVASAASTCDITISTAGFADSRETFVYVDGQLVAHYQSDDNIKLTLSGADLDAGTHKIECIQYSGDDPSGTTTLYKQASYTVDRS